MKKPAFCTCKDKDADQLRVNHAADQRLCFCYKINTIPLLSKSEISSLYPSSVVVQLALCRTWLETLKTGFLMTLLKMSFRIIKSIPPGSSPMQGPTRRDQSGTRPTLTRGQLKRQIINPNLVTLTMLSQVHTEVDLQILDGMNIRDCTITL